jgi:hypothetical protein
MKFKLIKLLLLGTILLLPKLGETNSSFKDTEKTESNTFQAGCWAPPRVPQLLYPANNTYAGLNSTWNQNPYMDWSDSTTPCPDSNKYTFQYQYESYRDVNLTQLAYRSSWLTNSQIPAPNTPDGTYYWRVKARDNFGHESNFSPAWLLVVDRNAPTVPVLSISDNNSTNLYCSGTTSHRNITLNWTASIDPNFDYYLVKDNSNNQLTQTTTTSYSYQLPDQDGSYQFKVEAYDKAGNFSASTLCGITLSRLTETVINSGDVIINELMWMGSTTSPADEWIELRNTKNQEIDLSNWQIVKRNSSSTDELMLTIPSGKKIPANGYFLITNYDKANSAINVDPDFVTTSVELNNGNLRLKLYKGDWTNSSNLIDTADGGTGAPIAGSNSPLNKSMERNSDPSTGWHTCNNSACNDTTYWDTEGDNYGTPKASNLSENDPSAINTVLDFYFQNYKTEVGFKITDIAPYDTLDYEITWVPQNRESQGIPGTITLGQENEVERNNFFLGWESAQGTKIYDWGMDKINIKIILKGNHLPDRTLEKSLDY